MKKVTFAILGMGNRGTAYASKQLKFPDEMEVTAMADPRPSRLEAANKYLHLPKERLFASGEEMLKQPKMADIMIIASQDAQHRDHAIAAMKQGYDLLLEKPIAASKEDCRAIMEAAHQYHRRVIVCHVLRYTVFYQQIKKWISSGVIGDIRAIDAEEMIGYYHYAHSFVRGNWHRREECSPLILAKCCHDLDLFLWLTGKSCKSVSSFGSQSYFTAENCPEGAKERCSDGCTVDCPFHAPKFYFSRIPGWPANVLHPEPTEENIMQVLLTGNYGRCVYKMDNNMVDRQVVNMLLEDGVTVGFCVNAFTQHQDRRIHVMGTKGDIVGTFKKNDLKLQVFGQPDVTADLTAQCTDFSGHGGGDGRLIYDVIRLYRGDDFDTSAITVIDRSTESHMVAFAAEQSRLQEGKLVDLEQFCKE